MNTPTETKPMLNFIERGGWATVVDSKATAQMLSEAKACGANIVDSDHKTLLPLLRLESGQVPAAAVGAGRGIVADAAAAGAQP